MFVNRQKEKERLQRALDSEKSQFIVVYGRRRCGKSALLQELLSDRCVFFTADLQERPLQMTAFARQAEKVVPGFGKPVYPDWESLLISLNAALRDRITVCLDEFPYLVRNNPALPSILQKIVDKGEHNNFHLIICGSSQQMMHSLAIDSASPLYGRADEILRVGPMNIASMRQYLDISAGCSVNEFSVWGGVPRYWEIRKKSRNLREAIMTHLLDRNGILYEEPERLFSDEMRTSMQAFSVLSLIGSGCNRLSEIAGRMEKPATQLSRVLSFLIDLGYIRREIPFGESVRSTKRSLYKIDDPFLNFYFKFVVPEKSRLEFGLMDQVWEQIESQMALHVSQIWEDICRRIVPFLEIGGVRFMPASRWWGMGLDRKFMEIDLVARSADGQTMLIGEVKWSDKVSAAGIHAELTRKWENIPFQKPVKVIRVLFARKASHPAPEGLWQFTPEEVATSRIS